MCLIRNRFFSRFLFVFGVFYQTRNKIDIIESTTGATKISIPQETKDLVKKTGDALNIPPWGVVSIFIGISIVLLGVCFLCIRRCCRKRRGKDGKKGMKGVDLKSVQLLGSAYKEKVCKFSGLTIYKFFFLEYL